MVRLVSAMLVASTTLRDPAAAGASAASCASARQLAEQRQQLRAGGAGLLAEQLLHAADLARARAGTPARRPAPRAAPASPAAPRGARAAPGRAPRAAAAAPCPRSASATRNARPGALTSGASPSRRATAVPSRVADMTSRRSSGARLARASRHSARPRSACRLRSWNSSKMTAATPSSAGSDCSIRVSTPSVTHLDARGARDARVETHAVADGVADALAERLRHARGDRTRGQAPRLEHQQLPPAHPRLSEQRQRHHRALAGAGRGLQHRGGMGTQRGASAAAAPPRSAAPAVTRCARARPRSGTAGRRA